VGLRRLCRGLFLLFGLFLGFALAAADRGAQDVAEAGAGFGGAEFLHCPLLLIHFARLDRQRNAPGGAVDRGDLGIDPLADDMAADSPSILRFLDEWKALKGTGLKMIDVDYLLRNRDDGGLIAPTEAR